MINYVYKFRLLPTKQQEQLLAHDFWCTRFVYNYYLNKSIQDYQQDSTKRWNKYEYVKDVTELKKELTWIAQTNSQVIQQSLLNLDVAYNKFFKGQSWFPNFKKKNSKNSIHIPQNFIIQWSKVKIPKYKELFIFIQHRQIQGKAKSLTISKDTDWKYYVSILVEKDISKLPSAGLQVWCDLWIKDLLITSDGDKYKTIKQDNTKIARLQMWLAKKHKWSRRYKQLKNKIAKLHKHNANRRSDYNHKISKELVTKYDVIGLENLNVKWMVKNHKLAKAISNQWWSDLVTKIKYKAEWYWKLAHKVNRFYPTSKQCYQCWNVKRDLKLSDRMYCCNECGYKEDRDVNASKNILRYTQVELGLH